LAAGIRSVTALLSTRFFELSWKITERRGIPECFEAVPQVVLIGDRDFAYQRAGDLAAVIRYAYV
jgi:hypothetical protein